MLFSSSNFKKLTKDLVILAASYSAGFLIGGVIITVVKNERDVKRLYSRIERLEDESEFKK